MFIAAILDVISSRRLSVEERVRIQNMLREGIKETSKRFAKLLPTLPSISAGDSIEIISATWEPIAFLATFMISHGVRFRIGVGYGNLTIISEHANECDGPALWLAREALEDARRRRVLVSFRGEPGPEQSSLVIYLLYLFNLNAKILGYLLDFVWNQRRISEIAEIHGRTRGTISLIVKRHGFDVLREVIRICQRSLDKAQY